MAAAAAFPAHAQDWGQVATISSTLGVKANRLCVGEGLRSDIGCPSYAPSLTTAGDLSVTGNLSANTFIGDGSGLTGLASGDRITSGTTNVIATQDRSVTISTAGSQRVVIGESGNVGIGTSAPSQLLTVGSGPGFTVNIIGDANARTLQLNGGGITNATVINRSSNTPLSIQTGNYTGAGNNIQMSTGTASNSSGQYNAVVIGQIYNQTGSAAGTDLLINRSETAVGTGAQRLIDAQVGSVSRFAVLNTGNVGIGTTTPSGSLHVLGNSTSYATAPLQITNTPPAQNPSTLFLTTGWSGNYGTDYGLIGISKTALIALNGLNPSVLLPYGAQASNPHGFSSASSGYAYYKPYVSSSANDTLFDTIGDYRFLTEEAGAYQSRQVFRITSSGTVAVGLGPASAQTRSSGAWYPSSTLHVSGTARITSWTAIAANITPTTELDVYGTISATNILVNGAPITGNADRITSGTTNIIANTNGAISFTTAGTERMIITSSGLVGVGTSYPSTSLHVVSTNGLRISHAIAPGGYFTDLVAQTNSAYPFYMSVNNFGRPLGVKTFTGSSFSSSVPFVGGYYGLALTTGSSDPDASHVRVAIMNTGNVGIGTTSPAKTLDVSGTAQIASRTLVGGTGTPSATFQVSGSLLLAGNDNIPCTASVLGLVRRNPTTGRMQVCR